MRTHTHTHTHTHPHVTSLDWHEPPLALFHTNPAPDKAAWLSSEPPPLAAPALLSFPSLFIPSLISCPRLSPFPAAFSWLAFVCQVRLPHLPAVLTISFALSLQAWGLLSCCGSGLCLPLVKTTWPSLPLDPPGPLQDPASVPSPVPAFIPQGSLT